MTNVSIVHSVGRGVPVMSVQCAGESSVISMATTPPEGTYKLAAARVSTTDRPAYAPATTLAGKGLRSFTFSHTIWSHHTQGSIETTLGTLRALAERGKKVKFFNAGMLASDRWYWVEGVDVAEELKGDGNRTSRATLTWSLTEATGINKVDWTRTKAQEQPPIKIEAKGPEVAETSTGSGENSEGDGSTPGTITETVDNTPSSSAGGAIGGAIGGALRMF